MAAEDHPTNQKVLRLILEPLGVDLTVCDDGQAALKAYQAGRFDIVLMDMQMPIMDGLTATREIRNHERKVGMSPTPIVMVTANAMRQHRDQAVEAGATSHLAKPFTPMSLMDAIDQALSEQAEQEPPESTTSESDAHSA